MNVKSRSNALPDQCRRNFGDGRAFSLAASKSYQQLPAKLSRRQQENRSPRSKGSRRNILLTQTTVPPLLRLILSVLRFHKGLQIPQA